MAVDAHQRMRALFDRARSLDEVAQRALLDAECDELALRAELEQLLAAAKRADDPISDRVRRAGAGAADAYATPVHIGAYRVTGVIGEGGMGTVWRGERDDGEFVKQVAIKVIRGLASAHAIERLRRERQVLAGLDHPGIARLLDGGTTDAGEPFLVMDLVDGRSLSDWLTQAQPSLRLRMQLFRQLCEAVHFAHQRLVVHCDIKPGNIMVRDDGSPALLDFGIARLLDPDDGSARTATFAATPAYASPEQLLGKPVTMATDVFALGMVLYEMLAGRVPEREIDVDSLSRELPPPSQALAGANAQHTAFAPRDLRGDLDSIVRRAVRSEAAHRYTSAASLAADVDAWLEGRPVSAAGGHWSYLAGKFVRRHRIGVALGVAAMLGLVALSILLLAQYRDALAARASAEREATAAKATATFLQDLYSELDPSLHAGRAVDARELLDLGRARLEKLETTAPATRAALERTLANIYLEIGKPEPALEIARTVVARLDRAHADPRETIETDLLLARALSAALDFVGSRQAAERALQGALLLKDESLEASIRTTRAWAALASGDVATARIDYDRAEAIFRTMGDAGREQLARIVYNRAQLAEAEGDMTQALARYQAAQTANEALLGRDNPMTLISQFGVGKMLIYVGRNAQAREVLSDLIERSRRVHGADTMAVERAVAELANAERDLGHAVAARSGFEQAMQISLAVNGGRETLQYSNHLSNLAVLEEGRGDLERAEQLMRRSLALRIRLVGPDSLYTANAHYYLARILLARAQPDAAASEIDEALRIRRASLPADHELLLIALALQAEIAVHSEPAVAVQTSVEQLRKTLERKPPVLVRGQIQLLRGIGALAGAQGDMAAQIGALRLEVTTLQTGQSPDHPLVGSARLRLATLLLDAGQRDAAQAELDAAAEIIRASHAEQSPARVGIETLQRRLDRPAPT